MNVLPRKLKKTNGVWVIFLASVSFLAWISSIIVSIFLSFSARPLEQIYKKFLEKYLEFGHEKEQQYPQRTGINRKNTEKIKTWGIKNGITGHTIFVLR